MNPLIYQNHCQMSTQQIKEDLYRQIEQGDNRFLRILHAMTVAYAAEHQEEEISDKEIEAICRNAEYEPMTKAALKAELDEANAEFDRGEFVTIGELRKETEL